MVEVNTETRGKPQIVVIGKRKYIGIVSKIDLNMIPIDGGYGEQGGYSIQIPLASFPRGKDIPEKGTGVSFDGIYLNIVSSATVNATVEIVAADPVVSK